MDATRTAVRRARIAVCLLFLSFGMIIGTWTARLPAVKRGLDLSDGQLSVALLGFAAGAITGMLVIGRLVDRHGGATMIVCAAVGDAVLLVAPAYANGLVALTVSLLLFGTVHGTLNIAMNAAAVEVERAWGRPIMSSFHAVYSIGGLLGAATGGLFAYADLSVAVTFAAAAALVICLALWARRRLPAFDGQSSSEGPQRMSARLPGITFLGVLAFCCLVGEGAAADWSSVYLRDTLDSSPGFAAAAYAAFAAMMTAGRLAGDRLAARLGPVRLVRVCAALAAVGLGVALLIGHPIAGVVGFGCLGAGLSCIAPLVFSAAGNRNPGRAGAAIARVASLGYVGFLTGPIIIGIAAQAVGLGWALLIPAVLALFVAVTAQALRQPGHEPSPLRA